MIHKGFSTLGKGIISLDARTLKSLEFDKVIKQLLPWASTRMGQEKIEELQPSQDMAEVNRWQNATQEGLTVLRLKDSVPLGGIRDLRSACARASLGGTLNSGELLDIASTLASGGRLKGFIGSLADKEPLPLLEELINGITRLKELEDEITGAIDENGQVVDSASPTLRQVRGQIRSGERRVRERLEQMLRNPGIQKMLQDPIITIRNDRFVLPVRSEYRSAFGGLVHDQSASGATLFIEPEQVVGINNELRELKMKEEREVEKILQELSALVAESVPALQVNGQCLAELDFIFARAYYGRELKAVQPTLNEEGYLKIKKGRHPLIASSSVVPIDVELGRDYTAIVITGPNTGGKTVSLKTIGLLTLMAMAGLHIPADDGTVLSIFTGIYADIGDEQSIEQSLSTFSGHMTNISRIMQTIQSRDLVLFDELGAGTDPAEGAALAMSIIDYVHRRGARIVATTHYSELKAFAYERTGIINASVEFDEITLCPTYRLLVGVPGRSNAFAIASRLGLPEAILDLAKSQIRTEETKIDTLVATLEENQRIVTRERDEAEQLRRELEEEKIRFQQEKESFQEKREQILSRLEDDAKEAVKKAKKQAEEVLGELRQMAKEQAGIKEHRLIEAKKKLESAVPTFERKKDKKIGDKSVAFRPGDAVRVLSLNQKGEIIEQLNPKEYQVQLGILKMNVRNDDLEKLKSGGKKETAPPLTRLHANRDPIKMELDIRGNNVEDSILLIDRYLDEALMHGLQRVSIIHGKGTGVLGLGVQKYLKKHRFVKSIRYGGQGEGGIGATVVELK